MAGHSLGATLAEIEASQFKLRGSTFNGYGAVDLVHGVTEGGSQVTNFVMAGDPVSAASRHYGTMMVLASPKNVQALTARRYRDTPMSMPSPHPLMTIGFFGHGIRRSALTHTA